MSLPLLKLAFFSKHLKLEKTLLSSPESEVKFFGASLSLLLKEYPWEGYLFISFSHPF